MTETSRHIVIFLGTLQGGGAQRNMLRLADGLHARGHTVTLAVADPRGPNRSWVPKGVALVNLHARILPLALFPLAWLLRRRQPDVVISAISGANAVALAARRLSRRPIPVIVTERNTFTEWKAAARTYRRRVIIPWLVTRLYPRADAIVGVSQGVSRDIAKYAGCDPATVTTIYNPVADERIDELAAEPLPAQWAQWCGASPLLVTIGRLEEHKDHDTLIRAFTQVHKQRPDVKLAIIGEGAREQHIAQLISDCDLTDSVALTGFQQNPYMWMRRASALVMTSRFEGLPTVLIEALACGARVVATDCPSGAAEILDHGRWGTLIPVGDAPQCADAICDALDAGRWPTPPQAALAPYHPDTVVRQFESLLGHIDRSPK